MVGGAGERPAKVISLALCLRFPIAPAVESLRPPRRRVLNTKKRTQPSPMCRREPTCAVSVCVESVAWSESAQSVCWSLVQVV